MKLKKLVLIEWEDSALGPQGWKFLSDIDFNISMASSVGFIIKEDEKKIVLAANIFNKEESEADTDIQLSNYIIIPKSAIRNRRELNQF